MIESILGLRSKTQYNAMNVFMEEILFEMKNLGVKTSEFNIESYETYDEVVADLNMLKYDAVFTMNGIPLTEPVFCKYLLKDGVIFCTYLVDHPCYHHLRLASDGYPYTLALSPDYGHVEYIEKYYKNIWCEAFLPHGGCGAKNIVPYEKRKTAVSFFGSYKPPEKILSAGDGSRLSALFLDIAHTLILNPAMTLEDAVKDGFESIGLGEESAFAKRMAAASEIDRYVRNFYRRKIIGAIADAGIEIDVYGNGWDGLDILNKGNLKIHPALDYRQSLEVMADSKISLNIMPWFKRGSHERVFSSMLCGALALSDESTYLREECEDGKTIAFYSLKDLDALTGRIETLLSNEKMAAEIAANGYELASKKHTWAHRAREILDYINTVDEMRRAG